MISHVIEHARQLGIEPEPGQTFEALLMEIQAEHPAARIRWNTFTDQHLAYVVTLEDLES